MKKNKGETITTQSQKPPMYCAVITPASLKYLRPRADSLKKKTHKKTKEKKKKRDEGHANTVQFITFIVIVTIITVELRKQISWGLFSQYPVG